MNLKEMFNKKSVAEIGVAVNRNHPSFEKDRFHAEALKGLDKLELKGRVRQIAAALHSQLPEDKSLSLKILAKSVRSNTQPEGVEGFLAWPFTQYIEEFALDHFSEAMEALKAITPAMSAEFAIRPFLMRYEKDALALLKKWSRDENHHVRRLVSEGTRPRLPWGVRLSAFQKDPRLCIELLRTLKNDPELYVRKSVANHLNDISKDHPDFLVSELREWLKEGDENVRWIARHAARTLIKKGHKGALSLFGYKGAQWKGASVSVAPAKIKIGSDIELKFEAIPARRESWMIDYRIHHVRANGAHSIKVFKWTIKALKPGEKLELRKKHSFKRISTRRYYPGKHLVEVQVNGQVVAKAAFTLV